MLPQLDILYCDRLILKISGLSKISILAYIYIRVITICALIIPLIVDLCTMSKKNMVSIKLKTDLPTTNKCKNYNNQPVVK